MNRMENNVIRNPLLLLEDMDDSVMIDESSPIQHLSRHGHNDSVDVVPIENFTIVKKSTGEWQ